MIKMIKMIQKLQLEFAYEKIDQYISYHFNE